MKLLIVTQTVDSNDPILGFFVGWIREFAKHCELVHVMALNVGTHDLPKNVTVHCLGKSEGRSKAVWLWRLWRNSITLRKQYDNVFVHMNPEYVIFGALLWRVLNKKISLWYAHGTVTNKLRLAHSLTHKVFSSTAKGFVIPSKKVHFVGQGIDTETFSFTERTIPLALNFVTWGRISETKGLEALIQALAVVQHKYPEAKLTIVGDPLTKEDELYRNQILELITKILPNNVTLQKGIPPKELAPRLHEFSYFIQNGKTGSLDKVLLESICSGLVTISSNKAFKDFVGPNKSKIYTYEEDSSEDLTNKIFTIIERCNSVEADHLELRNEVIKNHSIQSLIQKILTV